MAITRRRKKYTTPEPKKNTRNLPSSFVNGIHHDNGHVDLKKETERSDTEYIDAP